MCHGTRHCRLSWSRHLPPHVPPSKLTSYPPLADHHRSPRCPTTTSHDPLSPVSPRSPPCPICEPPPTRYVRAASPYASPHADPPPFMRAALHACHLPVPPPSRAQALRLIMAEPLPESSHSSAPSPASPSPMSPHGNLPRQISVPGTCCCRASRTNSRSTACDTRVLSHSSTRRWQHQRIQHRICDVARVLDIQPLDAQRRVRQAHQASSFNSGTVSGPRPAAGWLAGRVGAHGMRQRDTWDATGVLHHTPTRPYPYI